MKNKKSHTIPLLATLCMIAAVIVLCGLGTWQIKRLEWKQDLISTLEKEFNRDAAQNPLAISSNPMQRGIVSGHYIADKSFMIGPRTHDGKPGYHVITPLKLGNGEHILINRGWVPLNHEKISTPQNRITITGLLRAPDAANIFTPANDPANNIWYHIDFEKIAQVKNLEMLWPHMLYNEITPASGMPIAQSKMPKLKNDHAGYAFFWFSLAFSLIVIYWLRFIRRKP